MTASTHPTADAVRAAEHALTQGPFGAPDLIRFHSLPFYRSLSWYDDELDLTALHPWSEWLAEAETIGKDVPPFAHGAHATGSILDKPADQWSATGPEAFTAEVRTRLGSDLVPVYAALQARLEAGVGALLQDCPVLGHDVLRYLKMIGVSSQAQLVGATWTDLPGLAVFGTTVLDDADGASDSLLHESLHSKMVAVARHFRSPFFPDDLPVPRVQVVWHPKDSDKTIWTLSRALDAFHVYSQLTVLWAARMIRPRTAAPGGDTQHALAVKRFQRVSFRAAFLSRQLHSAQIESIDHDRAELVDWLDAIRFRPVGLSDKGQQLLDTDHVLTQPGPAW